LLTANGGGPVGVDEVLPGGLQATVHPNPFSHSFAVHLTGHQLEEGTARLYDMAGRQVGKWQIPDGNELVVSVPDLLRGMYVLRLESGGQTILRRLVKVD
jgi:hypothetical protein